MAAMKPRTGDGPLEVTKEGRGIVMRVPVDGGGRGRHIDTSIERCRHGRGVRRRERIRLNPIGEPRRLAGSTCGIDLNRRAGGQRL